jgi:hypothetical protein
MAYERRARAKGLWNTEAALSGRARPEGSRVRENEQTRRKSTVWFSRHPFWGSTLNYTEITHTGIPETVLVPLDGSPLTERALQYAVEQVPTASITTIYIVNPIESVFVAESGGLPAADDLYEKTQARAAAIHDAAKEIAAEYDRELTTVTGIGRPGREILD